MTILILPSGEAVGSSLREPEAEARRLEAAGFACVILGSKVYVRPGRDMAERMAYAGA